MLHRLWQKNRRTSKRAAPPWTHTWNLAHATYKNRLQIFVFWYIISTYHILRTLNNFAKICRFFCRTMYFTTIVINLSVSVWFFIIGKFLRLFSSLRDVCIFILIIENRIMRYSNYITRRSNYTSQAVFVLRLICIKLDLYQKIKILRI